MTQEHVQRWRAIKPTVAEQRRDRSPVFVVARPFLVRVGHVVLAGAESGGKGRREIGAACCAPGLLLGNSGRGRRSGVGVRLSARQKQVRDEDSGAFRQATSARHVAEAESHAPSLASGCPCLGCRRAGQRELAEVLARLLAAEGAEAELRRQNGNRSSDARGAPGAPRAGGGGGGAAHNQ